MTRAPSEQLEAIAARLPSDFKAAKSFWGTCSVAASTPANSGYVTDMERLLRTRLRSASLIICVGFILFFSIYLISRIPWDTPLVASHLGVIVVTGVCSFLLCERYGWRLKQLRGFEYLLFLVPAAYFTFLQVLEAGLVIEASRQMGTREVIPALHGRLAMPWICMMFIYAIFIPNNWLRCAAHVIPMALVPLGIFGYVCLSLPDGSHYLWSRSMLEMILWLLVPSVTAIYGAHTLNSLRKTAAMARELGSYYLKQKLGAGGMGEVYLGEHKLLKRPCAIKLIRSGQENDPKALARFKSEVQATAQLTHWNTIEIFDYGHTEDGTFYYVMEFLPGMSLQELVDTYGPMPSERAIHFLRQVCDGLREAHDMGLIHRDIKPGNIFATHRGGIWDVAKLLDFGLVKSILPEPQGTMNDSIDGFVIGTPLFASPEWTLRDGTLDSRSDIYSLGAVAYFLVTGRPMFSHRSPVKVLFAHANEPVIPPRGLAPSVGEDFEAVILRCVEKSPERRFRSVEELAEALDHCLAANTWTQQQAIRWWDQVQFDDTSSSSEASDPAAVTQVLETSDIYGESFS